MTRAARPLLYAGVVAVVIGLGRVHAAHIGHYDPTGTSRFGWSIVYAAILCTTAYGFGLPDIPRTRRTMITSSVGAAWVGAVGISVVQLFVGDALLPRFVVFGSALLLPDWYRVCIRLSAGGRVRAEARDRVAVIADTAAIDALEVELRGHPERPASIIARVATSGEGATRAIEALLDGEPPTVVVFDRAANADASILRQVAALHERGVRVRTLTQFYEEWLGKLPLYELERASLLFDIPEVHRARYARAKRLLDLPLAAAGLLVLAVVTPLVLVGNLIGNRGPLLYRQERVGQGGSRFTILKFRTMAPRPSGALVDEWTAENDPRVTRFGRILRATHLDELPQVVNILRGDLGVVGPRPEQPTYVDALALSLPFYPLRHLVRPGLTGWAQVKYGYAGTEGDSLEKLQYEFWYLRHQSIRTDAKIVGRTIRSVVGSEGRGR